MRLSRYFVPVLKETPKEAEIVSHRLMLRAGMIRQQSAGIYSWLPCLFDQPWPVKFLPIAVNMVMQPVPTPARIHALGRAVRVSVAAMADDARVLMISTGGMSHQIHGNRFGLTNPDFDKFFLGKFTHDWEELIAIPMAEIMKAAGTEAGELAMWYAMRGALSDDVHEIYSFHICPEITGCGVVVIEENGAR